MKVLKLDSKFWVDLPPQVTADEILETIKKAAKEASKLLKISPKLTIIVKPNLPHIIDATGTGASTYDAELLDITFDPKRASEKNFLSDIYASVYHELNHAARFNDEKLKHDKSIDWIIAEGVATAFERDYVKYRPLWGRYDDKEVGKWAKELNDLKENFRWDHYMFKHPDGRLWIGYKVGTYIVDRAMANSGKSIIELTQTPSSEILKLSKVL